MLIARSIYSPAQKSLKQALIASSPEKVFMTPVENLNLSASAVLQELDALRKRLDQASEWFSGVDSAIAVHVACLGYWQGRRSTSEDVIHQIQDVDNSGH